MNPLYKISQEIKDAEKMLESIIDESGQIGDDEIFSDIAKVLNDTNESMEFKSLNIARMIKNKQAEKLAIDNEIKNLQLRSKRSGSFIDWYTNYLKVNIDGKTFSDSNTEIKWTKSQRVNIEHMESLPDDLVNVKIESRPDKLAIKKLLKSGETVPGATLEEINNIKIK